MNNRTITIGAVAIVALAAIFYFASSQKKVSEDIKVGILLGFTGPIESLTPDMASGAELAFNEASNSGELLGGSKITILRADSTCVDSAAATAAAEDLLSQGMTAMMGADCSGVTGAVATNVAVPNGFVMISPSATSPGLTDLEDKGMFFRTAPSDARGGQVLADITNDKGIKSVAITYVNSDYGLGLADVYKAAVEAYGITVTTMASHESDKADYSADVGVLSSAGGDALAVLGYLDNAGGNIIEGSLDSGAFDTFVLSDGMIGDSLTDRFGSDLNNSFGSMPGSLGEGAQLFKSVAEAGGINPSVYVGESYDAAALIVLAMQAGNSSDKGSIAENIMSVANAPGEKIMAGEIAKGLKLLASGKEIDYQGATDVTFTDVGEAEGAFIEKGISGGKFTDVAQR
ncbi:ABC transporter substrate-binding protein [Alphaproteobacteria bacterium]|jgi:branched-chain amino acid transport system substrate-binding protein|nr:ABC transporter substrate-binding protein [Alphaproteobacteria bacterium]